MTIFRQRTPEMLNTTHPMKNSSPWNQSSSSGRLELRHTNEAGRICPLAKLLLELDALVNFQHPIFSQANPKTLKRTRSRAFEIHTALVEPGPVTWTLKFLLPFQPVWSAAKMRADG